jgi:hypothetical protein
MRLLMLQKCIFLDIDSAMVKVDSGMGLFMLHKISTLRHTEMSAPTPYLPFHLLSLFLLIVPFLIIGETIVSIRQAQILKLLRSPRIDSKEPILPGCVCSLAGRYDNPFPTRFLAPIDYLTILGLDFGVEFEMR